ncbi:hypothetical protein K3495_g2632 [Podosphaera aphanis]|nr:hypothetical protein K3495_g2632 [Podosphaera aphanis]
MRPTDTALDLLTSQMHEILGSKKHVPSLPSSDIAGAFDIVDPVRLLHILRCSRIPLWLIRWVFSSLSDRSTSLAFSGKESVPFKVFRGVPQDSPLSPIIFLFYNTKLIGICDRTQQRISSGASADDLIILSYSESIEINSFRLKATLLECQEWARRHVMVFAPRKFHLMHFTRSRKKFNLSASLRLDENERHPETEVKILGVLLEPKLSWIAHSRYAVDRARSQSTAFDRLVKSTLGLTFPSFLQLYIAIVRPSMFYATPIWFPRTKPSAIAAKPERI